MKLKKRLKDNRYLIAEIEFTGERLIYLRDFKENTESLGVADKDLDVEDLWKKHEKDSNYCLPCELLLFLEPKVISAEKSVAELGISLETLEKVREFLKEAEKNESG